MESVKKASGYVWVVVFLGMVAVRIEAHLLVVLVGIGGGILGGVDGGMNKERRWVLGGRECA